MQVELLLLPVLASVAQFLPLDPLDRWRFLSFLFGTCISHLSKSFSCITEYWLTMCKDSLYSSAAIWDDCKQLEVQQQTPKMEFCFTRSSTRGCAWQRSGESIVLLLTVRANRCFHQLPNIFLYEQLDLLLGRCNQKSYKTIGKKWGTFYCGPALIHGSGWTDLLATYFVPSS